MKQEKSWKNMHRSFYYTLIKKARGLLRIGCLQFWTQKAFVRPGIRTECHHSNACAITIANFKDAFWKTLIQSQVFINYFRYY